ncbi:hypothetical protein [[Leptolyngbya] sp. PCC 7376]|uniref:hypothetical protein n=1 Tax=[Leptolyngbya] sp. PCC 7376 TaxID=111781 RepID=UPI00135C3F68|nr:hypothetical protein [[Leptolyngbya] sp. PCC 7376]
MMYWSKFFKRCSILSVLAIATALPFKPAQAESVFEPYKQTIREQIPVGLSLRLPDKILLSATEQQEIDNFTVRVFVSQNPSRLTLSLHSCQASNNPCLLGSFITENKNSSPAQSELARHKNQGIRITLKDGVLGYVIDSDQPQSASAFATVMWSQDNMIHTLSFPQRERQNMLYMALSMANSDSIFRP